MLMDRVDLVTGKADRQPQATGHIEHINSTIQNKFSVTIK
jgi:hypothetical protein